MATRLRLSLALLALALVLSAMLPGCSSGLQKADAAGPDWSRGIRLGTANVNNRPCVAWDPASGDAIVVWLARDGDQWQFRYARMDGQGAISDSRVLSPILHKPVYPVLIRGGGGRFHLLWRDSEGGQRPGVYHAVMAAGGDILAQPRRISDAQGDMDTFTAAESSTGVVDIFWADVSAVEPQLQHARLNAEGQTLSAPRSLEINGFNPACAADAEGTIHLVWMNPIGVAGAEIYYTPFDSASARTGAVTKLVSFAGMSGMGFYPPEVGLDKTHVYVVWSQEFRQGGYFNEGNAWTDYRAFPIGRPEESAGGRLNIPPVLDPIYDPISGAFNYGSLASLWMPPAESGIGMIYMRSHVHEYLHKFDNLMHVVGREYTYMPAIVPGQREEIGIILSAVIVTQTRRQTEGQVQLAFAVMKDGVWKGYELAAMSKYASMRPVAVADDAGELHIAWVDALGFPEYAVFYATTTPAARENINRRTVGDVLTAVANGAWNAVSSLGFLPMVLLWLLAPMVFLVIFSLVRPDVELKSRTGWISLGIGVVLYLASKVILIPSFLTFAPFIQSESAFVRTAAYVGFPIVIAALGLGAVWLYARRTERRVILVAFALFAAVDAVLSVVLYMPSLLGG